MDPWRRQGRARLWRSRRLPPLRATCSSWPPTKGSSAVFGSEASRRSPFFTSATTAASCPSAATCSARARRRRTPSSSPSPTPTVRMLARRQGDQPQALALPDRAQPVHQRAARPPARCRTRGRRALAWSGSRIRWRSATSSATSCETCAGLPVDQREALVLAELHDNSHVEVAAILGCDREKVKSLVFQARSSLIQEPRGTRAPLRGDQAAAERPARRVASAQHDPAPPQGLRRLPSVSPRGEAPAPGARGVAAGGALRGAQAGRGQRDGSRRWRPAAAAGGGTAAGVSVGAGTAGPLAALAGKLGVSTVAVKGAAATVAVTVAAGGGAVAVKETRAPVRDARPAPIEQMDSDRVTPGGAQGTGGAAGDPGAAAVVPGVLIEEERDRAKVRQGRRRVRKERRLRRRLERPTLLSAGDRARRKAERRQTARQRKLERRQRRESAERPRKVRRKKPPARKPPAPRKTQPPAGTTPADPAPTDPPPADRGPTFPSR